MRGTGESAGSQSRTCSKRNTLKRCKNNGVADNVVLIDVDSDNIDNVIIIDVPESLKQKLRGSSVLRKEKKFQFGTVICIDDDMSSDDESSDNKHPGTNVEGDGDFSSVASSSGRFFPASNHIRNSVNAVGDEFVQEIFSPLKLSKCKRTYSGKASSRNCYGLGPESHSGSSDNDCPDYDFMEDSSGELRELWEKANMKKKYEACNGQSGRCNQATASELRAGTPQDIEVENVTDQHTEADIRPSSRNAGFEKENSSPFLQTDVGSSGSTYNNSKNTPLANFGLMSTHETQSNADNWVRAESLPVDPPFNNADGETTHCGKHGGSSFWDEEEHCSRGPSFCFSHKQGSKQVNHTNRFSQDKVKTISSESCISNSEPTVNRNFGCGKTSLPDEEASSRTKHDDMEDVGRENFWQTTCCNSHFSNEFENGSRSSLDKEKLVHGKPSEPTADINFGCGKASLTDEAASVDMEDVGRWQTTCCNSHFSNEFENGSSSSLDKEKLVHGETSFQNIKLSGRTQESHGGVDNAVGAGPGETFCENPPLGKSGLEKEKGCCQDKVKPFLEEPSFFVAPRNEAHTDLNMGARELAGEFMSNPQHEEKDSPFHAQDGTVVNAVQGYVISNREKLKETDEYKRAVEEEWASRQRVLQLQAEESQKLRLLRKRKKAESMRLLDMERRQKQRVEEMREVQKKDEENMNLKEQLRAEVRKELNQLESTCRNMASLLRGLGIQVGGGSHPLPHEVRAAYKRALLSFHPDRASGSDIRQLVEAEEKFKLISRMKEKFLLTS